jgi:hypothetical protein
MKTTAVFLVCLSGVLLLNVNTALAASYADTVLADGPIAYYRFNDVPPVATNSGSLGPSVNGTYLNGATAGAEAPRPPQFPGFESDNTALQLDGVDDFVQGASMFLNTFSNVTMSGWIRRAGPQLNRTGLWGQDNLIEFGYIDNNTVQAWVDNFETPVNVATPFPDLEWDYLALVVDGNALRMTVYTNGLAAGSASMPSNNYNSLLSTAFFVVGGDTFGNGTNFNGQIDEVAIFDKALTAQQIAAQYFSTVPSPPIITQQPQSTNVFEGADVILSVGVTGPGPFFYQWFDFGTPIPNQTNSTLVFSNITANQGSTFQVEITNAFGTVQSALADIIVSPTVPPVITQEPASITRYAGVTATLTVVATGGSKLEYQWQKSQSNIGGATNASLTFSNVQPANAGDYRVIVSNSAGSTTSIVATITVIAPPAPGSYAELIVSCDPLAYWRLNETNGSIAFDYVGGNDATYVNPAGVPGTPPTGPQAPSAPQFPGFETNNLAGQFDGSTVYVMGPTGLMNNLTNFSMVGWIRRATNQADRTGLFGQNDIVEYGYIDNNTLQLWTDDGLNVSPNPFPNDEWAHVAVVGEGSPGTARMYTNGVLAASRSHSLPGPTSFPFNIGGGGIFDGSGNFFNGQIDEVAVFNQALSSEKICSLYLRATGKPVILSIAPGASIVLDSKPLGVKHDGSDFGATWLASSTDNNFITRTGLMQFVAADLDQITLAPNPDFNSPTGTITFWMRSAGTAGAGNDGAMLFDRRSSRGDVIVQDDDGSIFVQANDGAGTVNSFNTTNGTVSDNLWHNIAYVYNQAGATTVYIDGVQSGSQVTTRPWSWEPAQQIELGRSHDGYWKVFDGELDDFRIYNRILTAAEIMQIVNSDAVVDPAALKVRFNFDSAPSGVASVTIDWLCGTLQSTDTLVGNGPGTTVWTDVPNATPPYVVNSLGTSNQFYRVKY